MEQTHIHIIYFSINYKKNKFSSGSKSTFSRWERKNGVYYITEGVTPGWCYIHNREELGSFVTVGENSGYVGNHLTFGLKPSKEKIVLKIHDTQYMQNDFPVNEYDRYEEACDIYLEDSEDMVPLNRECLYKKGITLESSFTIDKQEVVQDISKILYGSYRKEIEGGLVKKGKRGGLYIEEKGHNKRYLTSGGALPISFSDDGFIQFITKYVLNPVAALKKNLIGARMIFDEKGELGRTTSKHIVLMYEFEDVGMHLYLLEAKKAFMAYAAYRGDTTVEKSCLEEFLQMARQTTATETQDQM